MISRRQVINTEELSAALIDASLRVTSDADGLSIMLSAPDAILRLQVDPNGHPSLLATWYEAEELCAYEAEFRPLQSATGTASSSVTSWQLTRVTHAPQNGAANAPE